MAKPIVTASNVDSLRLVTVAHAAELLSISVRSAWRLVSTRELEVVRLRGATRVTVASIEGLIARGGAA
jgi:hypothetical protein